MPADRVAPTPPPVCVRVLAALLRPLVHAVALAQERVASDRSTPPAHARAPGTLEASPTRPGSEVAGADSADSADQALAWSRARRYWELEAKVRLGEALTPTERHTYADLLRRVHGGVG